MYNINIDNKYKIFRKCSFNFMNILQNECNSGAKIGNLKLNIFVHNNDA